MRLAWIAWGLVGVAAFGHCAPAPADPSRLNAVQSLEYGTLHGGRVAIRVGLKRALKEPPAGFRTFHPAARIVLELPDTAVATAQKSFQVDSGVLRSVHLVQHGTHTRLVLNLVRAVGYEIAIEDNSLSILLEPGRAGAAGARIEHFAAAVAAPPHHIREVGFQRGEKREGRVIVSLSSHGSGIDVREQGRQLVVDFFDTGISPAGLRRLDVQDFATPVASIATYAAGSRVRMLIEPVGPFEYAAYQSGGELVIALTPASR
ncbi:MAG: AMIN domain-containing protein [Burkholderiales bacterium]